MKYFALLIPFLFLSACMVTVEPAYIQRAIYCNLNDTKVYGHADIYRSQNTTVRIKETVRLNGC